MYGWIIGNITWLDESQLREDAVFEIFGEGGGGGVVIAKPL